MAGLLSLISIFISTNVLWEQQNAHRAAEQDYLGVEGLTEMMGKSHPFETWGSVGERFFNCISFLSLYGGKGLEAAGFGD